jgi:hemolysin activation/secretion protein
MRLTNRFCGVLAMACALASGLLASGLQAQTAPPSVRGSPLERVAPLAPAPSAPPSLVVPEGPAAAAPPGAASVFLTPTGFVVDGVTAYPAARITALTQPLVGTRIAATEVFALAQRIEKLYRDDGYFLTVVVVPRQTVADGVVRLSVVEGYIGRVTIEGEAGPARERLERIVGRVTESRPARIDQVERWLLLADDMPGTALRTVLRRGNAPGSSDMVVQVRHVPVDAVMGVDNRGSRYQGPLQIYGFAGLNAPTRLGDRLELQFFSTGSREQNFGQLAYTVPLTDSGLALRIFGGAGQTRPDLDLREIGYVGNIGLGGAQLTYPLIRTRDENLNLRAGFDFYHSRTTVGLDPPPKAGKVLSGQSDTRSVRLEAEGDLRDRYNGYNTGLIRFSKGLDIFGATAPDNALNERPGADPQYFKTYAEFSRLQGLWANEQISLNLLGLVAGQYSTDVLPAVERMYLGGDRLGRGYYNGQVAGDRALAGTLELQLNFLMTNDLVQPNELIPVQLYTFYDAGTVRNLSPNDVPSNRLNSFGVGTRIDFSTQVSGEVELTRRLKLDVDGVNAKELSEDSIYARLVLRY